jgi:homoserine/homoserine lactone efflux protein
MELNTWMAYFLACVTIAVSPGNGAVLSMSHGLSYGVRKTSVSILGLQAGLLVILLLSALGLGALLLASETLFTAVKWVGAAYLVWLGVQLWRAPVAESAQGVAIAPQMSAQRRFGLGFFTNVTNPKGIVFLVAVLPQFMNPNTPNLGVEVAILAATMVGVDLVVMHGYAGLAAQLAGFFKDPKAMRLQNRVFGGVLMAAGLAVLAVRRA